MNTTRTLSQVIAQAVTLIENNAQSLIGNMSINDALHVIERLQAIRDAEAIHAHMNTKACIKACSKVCTKQSPKERTNGL